MPTTASWAASPHVCRRRWTRAGVPDLSGQDGTGQSLTPSRAQHTVRAALDGIGTNQHYRTIMIGPDDGVLIQADPIDPSGHRAYAVHWADASRDIQVVAVTDPTTVVAFARSFSCPSS